MSEEKDEPKNDLMGMSNKADKKSGAGWNEEEPEEAELTVDVYQTPTNIIVQAMVAGVNPEDIELTIGRDVVTVRGKREESRSVDEEDYFTKELYWGIFSRTITLPTEVEPDQAEATERHGLLTLKLQKVDKERKNSIKVKSI
jgi:HSP20 family protein